MRKAQQASTASPKVASQRVVDVIAERILSGQLSPGQRIKQDDLAAELDVSRIPVRDALRILETRGLIELKANIGARVASLSVKDMELSYRIREQLEPMLLAESLPNLTDADLEVMREAKAGLATTDDVDRFLAFTRQFHWTAFSGHQAPLLAQIVERLWDTTEAYRRVYAGFVVKDKARMTIMRAERDLLFGAIERREVVLAPEVLAIHIRRTRLGLVEFGPQLGLLER